MPGHRVADPQRNNNIKVGAFFVLFNFHIARFATRSTLNFRLLNPPTPASFLVTSSNTLLIFVFNSTSSDADLVLLYKKLKTTSMGHWNIQQNRQWDYSMKFQRTIINEIVGQ